MMTRRYLLCTGNPGKAAELRTLLPADIELVTLADVGLPADLPETGGTLEENALQKARFAHGRTALPCIADDTGLEVDALQSAPGVRSARYAGPAKDAVANMAKLLDELQGVRDRSARFRTVIALVKDDGTHLFQGEVRGRISEEPRGRGGFGYDPVFVPAGSPRTFAEMDAVEKNRVSHRARAVDELVKWLAINGSVPAGSSSSGPSGG
ncbi:MAG: RdgB/HAM1 family non-canonical purine NTP pyrophosphatase [Flavobacteriales bacterium]|nr:RdgB/HAM1 family non-canonical purine NTP pyrophosphatase [Flavobacteriales bacterium]